MFLEGNVDSVESYLNQASFYVHSATYEPFGLVLLEAMASSMVCVSLNGKGNLDIHEEGRNGFIIEPANPKVFAQTLVNCAKQPQQFLEIAEYSFNFAKRFDIKPYTSNLIEIYKAATDNRPELKSS